MCTESFLNSTDSMEDKKSINELSSTEVKLNFEDIYKDKTNCTELNKTKSDTEDSLDSFKLLNHPNPDVIQIAGFNKEKLVQVYTFSKINFDNNDTKIFQEEYKTIGLFISRRSIIPFHHYYSKGWTGFVLMKDREITTACYGTQDFADIIAKLLTSSLSYICVSTQFNDTKICELDYRHQVACMIDFELSSRMSIPNFPAGVLTAIDNAISGKLFIDTGFNSKSDALFKAVAKLAIKDNIFSHKNDKLPIKAYKNNTQGLLFSNKSSTENMSKIYFTIEDLDFLEQQENSLFGNVGFNTDDKKEESIESITLDNNLSNKGLESETNDSKFKSDKAQQTINAYNEDGFTLLHIAAQKGDVEEGRRLIQLKADIEITSKTRDGRDAALHLAAQKGHGNFVELLLDSGADVNKVSATGSRVTPLHEAAYYGHVNIVRLLISHDATIDAKDRNGYSPLQYACSNGKFDSVQLLLREKANPYLQNNNGETALFDAVCFGHLEIVSALVRTSENKKNYINMQNGCGKTVLHAIACKAKISKTHRKTIELLIKNGADPSLKDKLGQSPLDIAKKYNNKELISLFSSQTKKSELPIVAASILVAVGVSLGIAVLIYLEILAVGITVGACLLLAAVIVFSYHHNNQATRTESSLETASSISCLRNDNIRQTSL